MNSSKKIVQNLSYLERAQQQILAEKKLKNENNELRERLESAERKIKELTYDLAEESKHAPGAVQDLQKKLSHHGIQLYSAKRTIEDLTHQNESLKNKMKEQDHQIDKLKSDLIQERKKAEQSKNVTATQQGKIKKQEKKLKKIEEELANENKETAATKRLQRMASSLKKHKKLNLKFAASLVSFVDFNIDLKDIHYLPNKDNLIVGRTDTTVQCWLLRQDVSITKDEDKHIESKESDKDAHKGPKEFGKTKIWEKTISAKRLDVHSYGHIVICDQNNRIHVLHPGSSINYSALELGYANSFVFYKEFLLFWKKEQEGSHNYFIQVWKLTKNAEPQLLSKRKKVLDFDRIYGDRDGHLLTEKRLDQNQKILAVYLPLMLLNKGKDPIAAKYTMQGDESLHYIGNGFFVHNERLQGTYASKKCLTNAKTGKTQEFPFDTMPCELASLNDGQSFLFANKVAEPDEIRVYLYNWITQLTHSLNIQGRLHSIHYLRNGTQFSLCWRVDVNTTRFQTFDCEHLITLSKKLLTVAEPHVKRSPADICAGYLGLDIEETEEKSHIYRFFHQLEIETQRSITMATQEEEQRISASIKTKTIQ